MPFRNCRCSFLFCVVLFACRQRWADEHSRAGKSPELVTPTDSNYQYFPLNDSSDGGMGKRQMLDPFTNAWYSHVLFVLREPDLWKYAGAKEIYRFTYIPSVINVPVAYRITKDSDQYQLSLRTRLAVERVGPDGTVLNRGHKDSAVVDTTLALTADDWSYFQVCLQKARFWDIPGATEDSTLEGTQYILEGTKEGNYHFAVRWSAEDDRYPAFRACFDYLRQLAKKSGRHSGLF